MGLDQPRYGLCGLPYFQLSFLIEFSNSEMDIGGEEDGIVGNMTSRCRRKVIAKPDQDRMVLGH